MAEKKSKSRLPSFIRWIGWVILVQFILINISAALYAYKFTHFYEDKNIRAAMSRQNIFVKTWRLFTGPRFVKSSITHTPSFPYDTISLTTKNGTLIDAWYATPDTVAKGTVIFFHGITANKSLLLAEAGDFRYQGYNVMLVDFRAHGNSNGNTTTIGASEAEEVQLAYNFVKNKAEKNIFLYGVSMGAVSILKSISEYELKPAGAIIEMPFLSMQTHLQARARLLGFGGFPEKPSSFLTTGWISIERGFNAYNYNTARYAKKVTCPVLMQWGALDEIVLKKETDKIFKAIASPQKKLVVYDEAGHTSLLQNDPVVWRKETELFLEKNIQ